MDLIYLADEIEQRYRRYLETTFHFKDPSLQQSFSDALKKQYLSNGPFIESMPIFEKGLSPNELFCNLLGEKPEEAFMKAIDGDRQLYSHQEQAIQKVFQQQNIVVATGTGSGKTEAFLYPILLHLYQEYCDGTLNNSGVRALILYPMNALANDQRDRLGQICQKLKEYKSDFNFNFGQYIGETPENEKDNQRNAGEKKLQKYEGEIIFREEMRTKPPHILLTNYSMLEYLLIRPWDSPFFDDENARYWTFFVLDEAHQYRGAKGIEMGMLIRRLKQRLIAGGIKKPLRCIATSATITSESGDNENVARFASVLFGENFKSENIILGRMSSLHFSTNQINLQLKDYQLLLDYSTDKSSILKKQFIALCDKFKITYLENENYNQKLGEFLLRDICSQHILQKLMENPCSINDLSDQFFFDLPAGERKEALITLITLLGTADYITEKSHVKSLIALRYHFFLRALEGAFIQYFPEKTIILERCKTEGKFNFEVALCRNCGQHYLVGLIRDGKLIEPIRDPGNPDFEVQFFRPIENEFELTDILNHNDISTNKTFFLCIECGAINRNNLSCKHDKNIKIFEEKAATSENRSDQIAACSKCGYNGSGRDPVREIIHGHDGPHAVIATTLFQKLPERRKKILAFADNRQEAAFFAWYLENSYKDIFSRSLILRTIKDLSLQSINGFTLNEVTYELQKFYNQYEVFPENMGEIEIQRESWINLLSEFLTIEYRISLEGVGLIQWCLKWPEKFQIPIILQRDPWNLNIRSCYDLLEYLIDSMRYDHAIALPDTKVSLNWKDLNLGISQMCMRIGEPRKQPNVRSWDSPRTRRFEYLMKLLRSINPKLPEDEQKLEVTKVIRIIWESFNYEQPIQNNANRLLIPIKDCRQLNPAWYQVRPCTNTDIIYRCDSCGQIQKVNLFNICPEYRCSGKLYKTSVEELRQNHYRILYEDDFPGIFKVEEHTAQLSSNQARQYQKDFKSGKINLLSCSTTFELGVDLGDLDIVFLRNIPPESFNYAQRVGRAGRRKGMPGFTVTYCRRNPHDLYHFQQPIRIIKGKIRPPILTLSNRKIIIRHITATILSLFFRRNQNHFKTVETFLGMMETPTLPSILYNFYNVNKRCIKKILVDILSGNINDLVNLNDENWINEVFGNKSRLIESIEVLKEDYRNVLKFKEESKNEDKYKEAEWARKRALTIKDEDILSFLSRQAIIPKYGFPVDVVELDTHPLYFEQTVSLTRDLTIAISEFAPTSKVIANKKEWQSYAVKRVIEKELPIKFYRKCSRHNFFVTWSKETPTDQIPKVKCCSQMIEGQYLIPKFGFITRHEPPKNPQNRVEKLFSTRPYFDRMIKDPPGEIQLEFVKLYKTSPGVMVVICEGFKGQNFYICENAFCGAGFRKLEKSHLTPFGNCCNGKLKRLALGHEIITDIIRLQFLIKPEKNQTELVWLTYSLAYAILQGVASVLDIPSNDLNTTVGNPTSDGYLPEIILYDNVPGGAGLVAQLENKEILLNSLREALGYVDGKCGCNSSCYGCLRSYRNQFAHSFLNRIWVKDYLKTFL